MRIRLRRANGVLTITGHGGIGILLLIAVLSVPSLLSLSYSLSPEEAAGLIRHHLKFQAGQAYAGRHREGKIDAQAGRRYADELAAIDRLRIESVQVGRLLPDYLFSVRPTYYAKAVIRDGAGGRTTRYFNFARGGALVLGESSRFLWAFVF